VAPKNCVSCIFNVTDPSAQIAKLGGSIDAGFCGKGKGPTALPFSNSTEATRIGEIKAKSCDQFETDKNEFGSQLAPRFTEYIMIPPVVMLPDPSFNKPTPINPTLKNCLSCSNFVKSGAAVQEGLWNMGVCRARGIIIPPRAVIDVARDCDAYAIGAQDPSALKRMTLMPEYTDVQKIKSGVQSIERVLIDPMDYPTDADVEPEDAAKGIKAWRKIEDPEGRASVMLPIFDPAHFDVNLREIIPQTGDDEYPEQYIDHQGLVYRTAVLWTQLDETPALWGIAGTGKTEFYRHMAWLMGLPFHRISVTASTEVEDLAGKMHFSSEKGTYFEYGRIPNAWKSPGIVCLDEPNVGPPDVWQFIRPLTDNSKQLVLDMNNGERVSRHEHAFLGMAMNPAWDVRNSGAESLADADGSRLMHIYVELPNEQVERAIIIARCKVDGYDIPEEELNTVMKIAKDLRDMSNNETLPITWGVRQQIKVARALKWFAYGTAYKLAAADYMEPEHQELIKDVVKSHTGTNNKKLFGANYNETDKDAGRMSRPSTRSGALRGGPVRSYPGASGTSAGAGGRR